MIVSGLSKDPCEHLKDSSIDQKKGKLINPREINYLNVIGDSFQVNHVRSCGLNLKLISSSQVISNLLYADDTKSDNVLVQGYNHSELISTLYTGGLKVWACTNDLIQYISENYFTFQDKNILVLGCGASLIGIISLKYGGHCCFQDHNEEVMKYVIIPNVMLNIGKTKKSNFDKCSFYVGDWNSLVDTARSTFVTENKRFDFIFTTERICNKDNLKTLHELFYHCLKLDGTIYLATRAVNFGINGCISDFKELLFEKNLFSYHTCWISRTGAQREIVKIKFRSKDFLDDTSRTLRLTPSTTSKDSSYRPATSKIVKVQLSPTERNWRPGSHILRKNLNRVLLTLFKT